MVGLDVAAVTDWIAAIDLSARPPIHLERVGNGFSNLTFLVRDAAGGRWILRRPPLGRLLASAHDVAREYRILTALGPTEVPVPKVFGLCEDPAVSDVPLVLMEYVDGVVIDSLTAAEHVPPSLRARIGLGLPRTLAHIHAVDLDATGLSSLSSSRTPYAARQLRRWYGQWERSRTQDLPLIDELAGRFSASVPEQTETTLVHGDFHLLNVIVGDRDGEVRAVVDWELCTLGDPIADLGGMLAYWTEPGELPDTAPTFSTLAGAPPRDALVAAYAEVAGRDTSSLGFWHALGLWKIAIIAEGVIRRALDTPGNVGDLTVPTPKMVAALARRACKVAADHCI